MFGPVFLQPKYLKVWTCQPIGDPFLLVSPWYCFPRIIWQHCNTVFLNWCPHLLHILPKLCSCWSSQCDRQVWAVTKFIPWLWTQQEKGRGHCAPPRFVSAKCQVLKQSWRKDVKHVATKLQCQEYSLLFWHEIGLGQTLGLHQKESSLLPLEGYELLD